MPAVAIPHPVGDPSLTKEKEDEKRLNIVDEAVNLLGKSF